MVYAVVESGGKQYKAVEGEFLEVDLLPEELGKKKVLDKVLLLVNGEDTQVGSPYLSDVNFETKVSEHFKGPKITIFNYRAKERYRVKTGHRQKYTKLLIESINFPGKPKDSKISEEAATPVKKVRTKPTTTTKKPVEKTVKAKSDTVKPVKKTVKAKSDAVKPVKKTVKKASSAKTK